MRLVADDHYTVNRGGFRDYIRWLGCKFCPFSVNVLALRRSGDKSGAGRYCRARAVMVKHIHAEHREAAAAVKARPGHWNAITGEHIGG